MACYDNDFNTCELPTDWTPLNSSRWSVGLDGGSCAYYINTTDYSALSGDRLGEYSLIDSLYLSDFSVSLRARSREDLSSNVAADYDIVFGYQDTNNYYYVMFNSGSDLTGLYKVVDGTRNTISTYSGVTIQNTSFSDIEISRLGSRIVVIFFLGYDFRCY